MAKLSLRTWKEGPKHVSFWVVTVGGSGMLKPAPGTWGSLVGLITGAGMIALGVDAVELVAWAVALTILSSKLIYDIEMACGIHDAPEIVVDEVAGQWLALLPVIPLAPNWGLYILAFLLFRAFDIIKPWPIGWLDQKVGGGIGVMIDDIVAGLMAAIVIWILLAFGLLDWIIQWYPN